MAEKQSRLSIVLRAVDRATATIRGVGARVAALAGPLRGIGGKLAGAFGKLPAILGKVLGAIGGLISKIPLVGAVLGGVIGGATAGLLKLVDHFDELGDKAEAIGVGADFLAQMRYAAEKSGASVEALDSGLQNFSKSLGQARAGTGRMASFLNKVSPALLKQLKGAKSNEAAFDLLASAMAKIEDPAKRAALAQATLGDAELGPLFARGADGIKQLRDRYAQLAGSQEDAVKKSGEVDDAMKDLHAATDGVKAAIVSGLAPALTVIVKRLQEWFVNHREDIAEFAAALGEKIPGAVQTVVQWIGTAIDKLREFFDEVKGIVDYAKAYSEGGVSAVVDLRDANVAQAAAAKDAQAASKKSLEEQEALLKQYREKFSQLYQLRGATNVDLNKISPDLAKDIREGYGTVKMFGREQAFGVGSGQWERWRDQQEQRYQAAANAIEDVIAKQRATAAAAGPNSGLDASGNLDPDALARSLFAGGGSQTSAKVTIDIANAPRGTRVRADPQSTADVDLSVGYNMLPGTP